MTPAEASKAKNLVKNVDNLTATVGRAAMSTPAKNVRVRPSNRPVARRAKRRRRKPHGIFSQRAHGRKALRYILC